MVERDEIYAEWDRTVDDLVGRLRKGLKAKFRDILECDAITLDDAARRKSYYWLRIILWLYVLDQYEPPNKTWSADVEKLKPFI